MLQFFRLILNLEVQIVKNDKCFIKSKSIRFGKHVHFQGNNCPESECIKCNEKADISHAVLKALRSQNKCNGEYPDAY